MRADRNWVTANADTPSRPNRYPAILDAEKSFLVFDIVTSMLRRNVKGVYESLYLFSSSPNTLFTATTALFPPSHTFFPVRNEIRGT